MNESTLYLIIQIISSGVTNLLIFLLFYKLYKPHHNSKPIYVVAFVITTICIIGINRFFIKMNLGICNSLFLFVYSCVLSTSLFKAKLKKSFLCNAIYIVISVFVDVFTVLMVSLITQKGFSTLTSNIQYVIMYNSSYCMLMIVAWILFLTVALKNKFESIKSKQIVLITLYVIFALFIEYNFTIRIKNTIDILIDLVILIGFFASAIYIIFFTNKIASAYENKYRYDLIQKQNELQLEHFNEISEKYERSRIIIHDIKKHLDVLNSLKSIDSEKAKEYVQIIENNVDSLFGGFHCSNRILSIIMSQKITLAEKENIQINTQIEDLPLDSIEDVDMTAIFANLWDNAIEACLDLKSEKRFINVIVGRVNDFVVISFENSFNGAIRKEGASLLSTKKMHEGIGYSIIKAAIEKYQGTLSTQYDNTTFKVEILIPL